MSSRHPVKGHPARRRPDKRGEGSYAGLRDQCLGPVTFHGKSVAELRNEFAKIDQGVPRWVRRAGPGAGEGYAGRFNIRMSPELHRALAAAAAREGKSLNAWAIEHLHDAARID